MKLNKSIAIPALALIAGLGLAACGSDGSTPASSTSMPVSNEQIVNDVTGTTAPDGTTAENVTVVGSPRMSNEVETAQIDVVFSDSSQWREVYTYHVSTDKWDATAENQEN